MKLPKLKIVEHIDLSQNCVLFINNTDTIEQLFTKNEVEYINKKIDDNKTKIISIQRYTNIIYLINVQKPKEKPLCNDFFRTQGNHFYQTIKDETFETLVFISNIPNNKFEIEKEFFISFTEGFLLSIYKFDKYKKDLDKSINIKLLMLIHSSIKKTDIIVLSNLMQSIYQCRDWVNEPLSTLTALKFAEEIESFCKSANIKTNILNKTQIEALKMGGLLAVNKGSLEPPVFIILEWNPKDKSNDKTIVIVGKGVVFDSGGMNLKPGSSMETMKSDMAGAATVATSIYALAKSNCKQHIIGLIPCTENRPDGNAYVPGDIIKMFDGTTVEVLNTDAEGRLILADALSFAKKYNPDLVINIATLTGSASSAIGKYGIVAMQSKAENDLELLKSIGYQTHERIAEFPFWDDYAELLKSDIADLKNIGGREAGAITAGKFLQHFTDYPFIHLDIAGVAFSEKFDSYKGKGGTATGLRLLFNFINKYSNK